MSGQESKRPDELIENGPVTLRRYRADDVDAVFAAVTESMVHLRPWMPWAAGYTRDSAAEYLDGSIRSWADGTEYNYAILAEGRLVGSISLMARVGPGGLEIGYWVHRACTRRGLATAASAASNHCSFGRNTQRWKTGFEFWITRTPASALAKNSHCSKRPSELATTCRPSLWPS